MNSSLTITLLRAWYHGAPWLVALCLVGELLLLARSLALRIVPPDYWLRKRQAWSTRWMLCRYSSKWPWLLAVLGCVGLGAWAGMRSKEWVLWAGRRQLGMCTDDNYPCAIEGARRSRRFS